MDLDVVPSGEGYVAWRHLDIRRADTTDLLRRMQEAERGVGEPGLEGGGIDEENQTHRPGKQTGLDQETATRHFGHVHLFQMLSGLIDKSGDKSTGRTILADLNCIDCPFSHFRELLLNGQRSLRLARPRRQGPNNESSHRTC